MSIFLRSSATCAGYLAASVLAISAAAPVSVAFAHGSGGGHFSAPHAMIGVPASHAPLVVSPHVGQTSGTNAVLDHGSSPQFGEAHHNRHPTPPTGSQTSPTSTVVTSPTDDIVFPPIPSVADTPMPAAPTSAATPSTAIQETPVPDTSFSTGGTLAVDQHPGGGGDTLASCMAYWQPDTTMTKTEWRDTCERTLNGLDAGGGVTDNVAAATPAQGTRHAASSRTHRAAAHHAQSLAQSQAQ